MVTASARALCRRVERPSGRGGRTRSLPGLSLPRGMIIGLLLTLFLYLLANLVYLRALPIEELGRANGIGEASATALFGVGWAPLITLAVFTSIFGCLASGVLTSSRIYLPMAQDGVFFRSLAKIHPRFRTPSASIVAGGMWATVLAFSGTYEQLGTFVIFAVYGVFAAAVRQHVVTRPRVLTWMRRTFAAAFVALGAKLAFTER